MNSRTTKLTALAIVTLSILLTNNAFAKKSTADAGLAACMDWCTAHNSSTPSRNQCQCGCMRYYVGGLAGRGSNACVAARNPGRTAQ